MTILAWGTVEQAITLGNDVGRGARTVVVSITHTIGSLVVGIVAMILTTGVYGTTPTTIPLLAVSLLLAATSLLVLSMHATNLY